MASYRAVHVQIHVGKHQSFVAVVARSTEGHHRRDQLLYRGAVDAPDVASVSALLRAAAEHLTDAADRL